MSSLHLSLTLALKRSLLTLAFALPPPPPLDFILHLCIFTLYLHHHFITATIYYMVSPFFLSFISCIILLHPFGYLSPYLSVSPFQLSLTLSFYCLLSFLILQSHHFILSLLFSKYFFLTTIPNEGLSLKRRIIKFFFKLTYFALESLIS